MLTLSAEEASTSELVASLISQVSKFDISFNDHAISLHEHSQRKQHMADTMARELRSTSASPLKLQAFFQSSHSLPAYPLPNPSFSFSLYSVRLTSPAPMLHDLHQRCLPRIWIRGHIRRALDCHVAARHGHFQTRAHGRGVIAAFRRR